MSVCKAIYIEHFIQCRPPKYSIPPTGGPEFSSNLMGNIKLGVQRKAILTIRDHTRGLYNYVYVTLTSYWA